MDSKTLEQQVNELQGALRAVRNRLMHETEGLRNEQLIALVPDLKALLERLPSQVSGLAELKSPIQIYERLQLMDPEFRRIWQRWSSVISTTGREAALEVLKGFDVHEGWHKHWGPLINEAWEERLKIEKDTGRREVLAVQRDLLVNEKAPEGAVRRDNVTSSGQATLLLALDLRYAAERTIADIAAYLNLSPPAVQLRITDFEQRVAVRVADETLQRQEVERFAPTFLGSNRITFDLVVPSSWALDKRRILLEVLPVWSEFAGTAGRPRTIKSRPMLGSRHRIWMVMFFDTEEVFFVPEFEQSSLFDGREVLPERIIEHAREIGYPLLRDAVTILSNSEPEKIGGD